MQLYCNCTHIWKLCVDFRFLGAMAMTLYGYQSENPCLVGSGGPNVTEVPTIDAEKCIIHVR